MQPYDESPSLSIRARLVKKDVSPVSRTPTGCNIHAARPPGEPLKLSQFAPTKYRPVSPWGFRLKNAPSPPSPRIRLDSNVFIRLGFVQIGAVTSSSIEIESRTAKGPGPRP
ncbi:hypothetical protein EVAR_55664_1 [Eumeta japonica]|uniref:Uncharacterized protein n=1 Tax=Eumeta variegata TaxID=151549 RepID=A0A4C1XX45_EUMVA|nr:hypothetical protein EVAR_55664_1 [Eumeta japonica]